MISTPIFTRLMSPAEYGRYGTWLSWQSIAMILVSLALSQGVHMQGLVKYESLREEFTSSLLGLTTLCVAVWLLLYLPLRTFWNGLMQLTTFQIVSMLLLIWTTATFQFWANEQRVVYSYRKLVIATLFVSLLKPILEIILVLHSTDKVAARILGVVLAELAVYSWMYVVEIKRGKKFYSKRFWLYALSFNIPLIPHYLSQVVLNSCDRIMIQRIIGDREAGIYNLAYSVSLIMTLFNTSLMQTISPWIYKKIKTNDIEDISQVAYTSLIFIAAVNLLLIVVGPEIVRFFAPEEYYEARWVIPPVALSVFFMFSYDLFAKFAFYYEKTRFIMIASVLGAVLNIILNYVCINRFGYIAAGYTTLICYMVYSFAHFIFMKKVCAQYCDGKIPYSARTLIIIAAVFVGTGLMLLLSYDHFAVRYSIFAAFLSGLFLKRKMFTERMLVLIKIRK